MSNKTYENKFGVISCLDWNTVNGEYQGFSFPNPALYCNQTCDYYNAKYMLINKYTYLEKLNAMFLYKSLILLNFLQRYND